MYKDRYTDKEKLKMVADAQSYTGDETTDNRFLALDEFHCANIPKGQRLYAFQSDRYLKKLCGGAKPEPVSFQWFFDQPSYDRFVKEGKFNSKEVSEYLQLDYWRDMGTIEKSGMYRDSIYAFDLLEDIRVPIGVCLANDQFGNGEGHQCFIPKDMIFDLQEKGLIVFNKEASLIHKGFDKYVSEDRCIQIDQAIKGKMDFCFNNNQKHCTISLFAVPAVMHEPIIAPIFDHNHYGKDSSYDSLKDEKYDLSRPITGPRAGEHFIKYNQDNFQTINEHQKLVDVSPVKMYDSLKKPDESIQDEHGYIEIVGNNAWEMKLDAGFCDKEADSSDIQQSFKGLNDLQKFLNSDNTEYLGDIVLQNEPYYL